MSKYAIIQTSKFVNNQMCKCTGLSRGGISGSSGHRFADKQCRTYQGSLMVPGTFARYRYFIAITRWKYEVLYTSISTSTSKPEGPSRHHFQVSIVLIRYLMAHSFPYPGRCESNHIFLNYYIAKVSINSTFPPTEGEERLMQTRSGGVQPCKR